MRSPETVRTPHSSVKTKSLDVSLELGLSTLFNIAAGAERAVSSAVQGFKE